MNREKRFMKALILTFTLSIFSFLLFAQNERQGIELKNSAYEVSVNLPILYGEKYRFIPTLGCDYVKYLSANYQFAFGCFIGKRMDSNFSFKVSLLTRMMKSGFIIPWGRIFLLAYSIIELSG